MATLCTTGWFWFVVLAGMAMMIFGAFMLGRLLGSARADAHLAVLRRSVNEDLATIEHEPTFAWLPHEMETAADFGPGAAFHEECGDR